MMIRALHVGFKMSLVVGLFLAASAAPQAMGQTTYSYVGDDFTSYYGPYNGSLEPNLTASITLSSPLGANFDNVVFPESYQISDGSLTLTNLSPEIFYTAFLFVTDATGQITQWAMQVGQSASTPSGYVSLLTRHDIGDSVFDDFSGYFFNNSTYYADADIRTLNPLVDSCLGCFHQAANRSAGWWTRSKVQLKHARVSVHVSKTANRPATER